MAKEYITYCKERFCARLFGSIGKGLAAGFIGTVAITVSQTIEMKKTGRKPSNTPLLAAEKIFEITPENDKAANRLNNFVHFVYGTMLGSIRGIMSVLGLKGIAGSILHTAAVQYLAMYLLPKLNITPPAREWGKKAIITEILHHSVYGLTAGIVFDFINRCIKPVSVNEKNL